MPDTLTAPKGFHSLSELQQTHASLLENVGQEVSAVLARAKEIEGFIRKAAATGTLLDVRNDRLAAQGLINFWVSRLGATSQEAESTVPVASPLPFEDTLLAGFDRNTLRQAVEAAEQWLSTLTTKDQATARRVTLRLVRLKAEGREARPFPIPRAVLHDADAPERVDRAIEALAVAGVVRVTRGAIADADQVALRDPELLRDWPSLERWLKSREGFRDKVESWQQNGRPAASLLVGDELEETRGYHDRNALEREFLEECRLGEQFELARSRAEAAEQRADAEQQRSELERSRRWMWVIATVAVAAIVCSVVVYWLFSRVADAERSKNETTIKLMESEKLQKENAIALAQAEKLQREALAALAQTDKDVISLVIELLKSKGESNHPIKKRLIIQAVGQLVATASIKPSSAWDSAKKQWDVLAMYLKDPAQDDNRWFRDTFFTLRVPEDGPTMEQRIALLLDSPEASRANRLQLLSVSRALKPYVRPTEGDKRRYYVQAIQMAEELAQAADGDRSIENVAAYADLFWRLYLGEMVLVENRPVEAAMVKFGDLLQVWEKAGGKAGSDLRASLRSAANRLKGACEADLKKMSKGPTGY